ncbi:MULTISPECIES: hypothetical protein [Halomonas]|uniref:Uncharacterized protein n=1 Tax=Halomonas casei TaxID=2742613 RepID=A0ABR9F4C0_9GAMM|nr:MULTISPECIES: hypothetical protein [Halomonas]MBE0401353.1 hypothetical protein [Halomonas casei]WKD30478.1 hypothetical protein NDQ72_20465 [Halomonas sp. KG2]
MTKPSRPRCQNAYDATEALNFVQNIRNPLTNLIIIDLDTVGDSGMMLLEALKNGADYGQRKHRTNGEGGLSLGLWWFFSPNQKTMMGGAV